MSEGKSISDFEIEKYFDGELTEEAKQAFEERMHTDVLFARTVREHKALREQLELIGTRNEFLAEMNTIHESEFGEVQAVPMKVVKTPKKEKSKPEKEGKGITRKQYFFGLGIAASVAVLLTVGSMWFFESHEMAEASAEGYQDLVQNTDPEESPSTMDVHEEVSEVSIPKVKRATAFAVAQDGYFVTNYHVVADAEKVRLTFKDEEQNWVRYEASVVLVDPATDLAMLQITDSNFTTLGVLPFTFAKNEVEIGQEIYSLGYPKEDVVFGDGTVSSLTGLKGDTTAYQVSVPLNKGNSGCPVFNSRGEVVAVVKGKQNKLEGTAFAVKSTYLLELINEYEQTAGKKIKKPRRNQISGKPRRRQIKHIQNFVYRVEVE